MGDEPSGTPEAARRDRPRTEESYGIPSDEGGTLPWSFVAETMADQRSYWVTTVRPDGRPHARPTWGVWVDGQFHCGGGEGTRWVRNLAANPAVAVHTESAESVVVVEGEAERLDEETVGSAADPAAAAARIERVDDAYEATYGVRHGTPLFGVHPDRVLAWTDFPADATRWRFDG